MRRTKKMKAYIEKEMVGRQNQTLGKIISRRKVLFPRTSVHQKLAQMKTQKKRLVEFSSWRLKKKNQK